MLPSGCESNNKAFLEQKLIRLNQEISFLDEQIDKSPAEEEYTNLFDEISSQLKIDCSYFIDGQLERIYKKLFSKIIKLLGNEVVYFRDWQFKRACNKLFSEINKRMKIAFKNWENRQAKEGCYESSLEITNLCQGINNRLKVEFENWQKSLSENQDSKIEDHCSKISKRVKFGFENWKEKRLFDLNDISIKERTKKDSERTGVLTEIANLSIQKNKIKNRESEDSIPVMDFGSEEEKNQTTEVIQNVKSKNQQKESKVNTKKILLNIFMLAMLGLCIYGGVTILFLNIGITLAQALMNSSMIFGCVGIGLWACQLNSHESKKEIIDELEVDTEKLDLIDFIFEPNEIGRLK